MVALVTKEMVPPCLIHLHVISLVAQVPFLLQSSAKSSIRFFSFELISGAIDSQLGLTVRAVSLLRSGRFSCHRFSTLCCTCRDASTSCSISTGRPHRSAPLTGSFNRRRASYGRTTLQYGRSWPGAPPHSMVLSPLATLASRLSPLSFIISYISSRHSHEGGPTKETGRR